MHTLARVKANTKATVSLERENQALRQQVAKLEKDLSALQSKLQLLLKRSSANDHKLSQWKIPHNTRERIN